MFPCHFKLYPIIDAPFSTAIIPLSKSMIFKEQDPPSFKSQGLLEKFFITVMTILKKVNRVSLYRKVLISLTVNSMLMIFKAQGLKLTNSHQADIQIPLIQHTNCLSLSMPHTLSKSISKIAWQ